jgi:peptidyl-prolyl cis-trans isomerase D
MANEQGKKPVVHTRKHIARLERERRQSRLILYIFIGILVVVVGLLGYGYLDINYFQLRRPVATVGGVDILVREFEARVRLQRQQLLYQYNQMQYYQMFGMDVTSQIEQIETSLNSTQTMGQTVLDQMIEEEIIRQKAASLGITVTDEELEHAIKDSYQFFPDGTPTPTITPTLASMPTIPAQAFDIVTITPTPATTLEATATPAASTPTEVIDSVTTTGTPPPTVTATFTATSTPTLEPTVTPTVGPTSTPEPTATPYTLEGFQGQYDETEETFAKLGFTTEEYKDLFRLQLLREKLFKEVTKDIAPSQDQVWARHILVADEAAAQSVLDRLAAGDDFGALATELSQDAGSAVNGGDLGWFGKGVMVAEFEETAFSLEPGEISAPVQSSFGYHIIQVIAHQERPLTAEQFSQAQNTAFTDFLTAAREELGVETFDLWMERIPTEPNFETLATDQANAASTSQAETAKAPQPTATP